MYIQRVHRGRGKRVEFGGGEKNGAKNVLVISRPSNQSKVSAGRRSGRRGREGEVGRERWGGDRERGVGRDGDV